MFNILFLNMDVVIVRSQNYLVGFQSFVRLIVAVISRLNNLQLGLGDIKNKVDCVRFISLNSVSD